VSGRIRRLHDFELEPEVRDWLSSLGDSDFKRVDEVCGMLAKRAPSLVARGPIIWRDRSGSCGSACVLLRPGSRTGVLLGTIVLLTVFRKTRQHDQRQIDRAVRAQKACERDHRGPVAGTYERQV